MSRDDSSSNHQTSMRQPCPRHSERVSHRCGELSSIRSLHRSGLGRRNPGQLVGQENNAMRSVIDRAGELIDAYHGQTFGVQYLLDDNDLPCAQACGDMLPAYRQLV